MEENKVLVPREMHGLWDEKTNSWINKPYYRNTKQLIRGLKKDLKRSDVRNLLKNNKEVTINTRIKEYCIDKYKKCGTKLFRASKVTYERYKTPIEV